MKPHIYSLDEVRALARPNNLLETKELRFDICATLVPKPRVEVCGHAGGIAQGVIDGIAITECRDCGHSWKEISP